MLVSTKLRAPIDAPPLIALNFVANSVILVIEHDIMFGLSSDKYKFDKNIEKGQYVMTAMYFSLRGEEYEHLLQEWRVEFTIGDETKQHDLIEDGIYGLIYPED